MSMKCHYYFFKYLDVIFSYTAHVTHHSDDIRSAASSKFLRGPVAVVVDVLVFQTIKFVRKSFIDNSPRNSRILLNEH